MVKIPDLFSIYKRSRRVELETTENNTSQWTGFKPAISIQVQRSHHSATLFGCVCNVEQVMYCWFFFQQQEFALRWDYLMK